FDVGEVVKLRQVAILPPVFNTNILVLMTIVFIRLGKPHSRKTALKKRNMIAAPKVAIATVNHHHPHGGYVTLSCFLDKASYLPRSRIVLAADTATHGGLFGLL